MRQSLPCLLVLCMLVAGTQDVSASHVRAGEITAKRISTTSLTYEITFTAYFDVETGKGAADGQNAVSFYVGDVGPIEVNRKVPYPNIGNGTTRNEYIFTYTFPAPGRFTISTSITNRNYNICNLGGGESGNIDFFVRTTLVINASLGLNRTPVLLNPPIDLAAVGQRYIHNPGAYDADGDSLAYRLVVPQRSLSAGKGIDLGVYIPPNRQTSFGPPIGTTEAGATPSTFSLDSLTGNLVWDAPTKPCFYNVAFVVEEWRNGILIGEIVRDMQIIVIESSNDRPKLDPLPDLCVEAGTLIQQTITANDKNADRLTLTSNSGVYLSDLVAAQNAQFSVVPQNTLGQVKGTFRWQTGCDHIRLEPYDVLVKVEDAPSPTFPNPSLFRKLVDIKTFKVRVYGPKPQNLRAEPVADATARAFRLSWSAYQCQVPGAQIAIYRKVGCSDFQAGACQPGLSPTLGYEEVARVGVGETFFVDDNGGQGLQRGIPYSYRLVVLFPRQGTLADDPGRLNGGGSSLPSAEFCVDLPQRSPLITHVTVDSTSQTRGIITVRWTRPAVAVPGAEAGPSQYRLFRATGLEGTNFTQIATLDTRLQPGVPDTLFIDKNLNTTQNAYRYRVDYYYPSNGTLTKLEDGVPASSVRLEQVQGTSNQVRLTWTANVPWDNTNRLHRIYREDRSRPGIFNRIAEVQVQGFESFDYTDDGTDRFVADGTQTITISPDSTYCYRVETVGSYNSTRVRPALLYNFSQTLCVSPTDTTRPCPPVLVLDIPDCSTLSPDAFCNQSEYTNTLSWNSTETSSGVACARGVVAYKIYYARYQDEEPTYLASILPPPIPLATDYSHSGLSSFAGCYYVTAVNRFGKESAPSNRVCRDNCPQFALPNVFTPNQDGKNDEFTPLNCPNFVETVQFVAFNRWGTKVFETADANLKWNGKSTSGQDLPSGQYFYQASVQFQSVERDRVPLQYKGWVQLVR
jgi:gliding motility-associated-like protein